MSVLNAIQSWLEKRQKDIKTIELNGASCQERTELINFYIGRHRKALAKEAIKITRSIADGSRASREVMSYSSNSPARRANKASGVSRHYLC